MSAPGERVDAAEIEQFGRLAASWWDPDGPLHTLHAINPLRLSYIERTCALPGLQVADVGCGGGILSEALAGAGAVVTGIDMAESSLEIARSHARLMELQIEYLHADAIELAEQRCGRYDVVTCLEVLEHVPDPAACVQACAALLKPGGTAFFSTINRNAKSFLLAIVAAEYVLGLLPRGTHRFRRLIRPSELAAWCRAAGLAMDDLTGLHFNPLTDQYRLGPGVDVNYLCRAAAGA